MQPQNDGDLFITRKRKKWKFAHFDAWANCFQAAEAKPATWPKYFGNKRPLVLEIGAGTADLSVELARTRPQDNFIAIDVKADRLYTGAKTAQEQDIPNIAFMRAHMDQVSEAIAPGTAQEIWITFPDPFPRNRSAKHRLTHSNFLRQYRNLLTKSGVVHFKTDNRELFLWSLEQFVADNWRFTSLAFDLHPSNLPANYKITTNYERRFMAEGLPINFVSAVLK